MKHKKTQLTLILDIVSALASLASRLSSNTHIECNLTKLGRYTFPPSHKIVQHLTPVQQAEAWHGHHAHESSPKHPLFLPIEYIFLKFM